VPRAADIPSEDSVFIEVGPAKHNNAQGLYLYSYELGAIASKSLRAAS
jgi:hypothetical protein